MKFALYVTLFAACSSLTAHAGEASAIARGRAIAEANCSPCHAVGTADESPTRINAESAFRDLAARFPVPMLVEAARTGSLSGHDEMPGFDFPLEDAHALLAYIDSLSPSVPGYVSGK